MMTVCEQCGVLNWTGRVGTGCRSQGFDRTCGDDKEARTIDTRDNELVVIDDLEVEELHLRQAGYLSQEPEDVNRPGHTAVQARRVAGRNARNVR